MKIPRGPAAVTVRMGRTPASRIRHWCRHREGGSAGNGWKPEDLPAWPIPSLRTIEQAWCATSFSRRIGETPDGILLGHEPDAVLFRGLGYENKKPAEMAGGKGGKYLCFFLLLTVLPDSLIFRIKYFPSRQQPAGQTCKKCFYC